MKTRALFAALTTLAIASPAFAAGESELLDKGLRKANEKKLVALAKKTFAAESVQFLISVRDYKAAENKKRGVLAERIMSYFIDADGAGTINISGAEKKAVEKAYALAKKTKAYGGSLFDKAEKSIRAMLVRDASHGQKALFEGLKKL